MAKPRKTLRQWAREAELADMGYCTPVTYPPQREQPAPAPDCTAPRNARVNERVIQLWQQRRDMIGATAEQIAAELELAGKDPASAVRKTFAWKQMRKTLLAAERSGVVGVDVAQVACERGMGMERES